MAKTNKGLVEYCKAQLGKPYWYGTFGNTATASLYQAKKKQYPAYYTANDFSTQYGKRVHDCVGLIKGYLWSETPTSVPKYNSSQDVSANGMRGKCKVGGDIGTMPETIGLLVFKEGHVGVYIGNGEVIEARGHAYGVVKTKLKDRGWKWWGECPFITYEKESHIAKPSNPKKTDKTYVLTCDWIWVRNKASTITGKKVGKLYRGNKYKAVKVSGNWYKITDGQYKGYFVCSGKYQKVVI
jgi:hypothetical protein